MENLVCWKTSEANKSLLENLVVFTQKMSNNRFAKYIS